LEGVISIDLTVVRRTMADDCRFWYLVQRCGRYTVMKPGNRQVVHVVTR